MKQYISKHDFREAFRQSDSRKDQFSYGALGAIFDYYEMLEEDCGMSIELDIIATCCEFTEYDNAIEAASEYFEFEGMSYGEDGEELETYEEVEQKAREFLEERTTVLDAENFVEGLQKINSIVIMNV